MGYLLTKVPHQLNQLLRHASKQQQEIYELAQMVFFILCPGKYSYGI